jgi:hypothetical protein
MIWVGVGAGAYAVYVAFVPLAGAGWAAAIVAGLLLSGPLGCLLIISLRAPRPKLYTPEPTRLPQSDTDRAALALLANVAKEKPLLAMLFAGLIGAAGAVLKRKA